MASKQRDASILAAIALVAAFACSVAAAQSPLGSMLTYQGQLKEGGSPAGGIYDMQFRLFDAATLGSQVGATVCQDAVMPTDGLFTVSLDFGAAVFDGSARWLELSVRVNSVAGDCNVGAYTTFTTRQPLTATPYALFALNGPAGSGLWAANGTAIHNTNVGNVGIGDANPLAPLHVGPEHLALGPADLHSEDVIIAGGDGVLGIYSDAAGGAGNGSAIALGEIGANLIDKWGIFRDTNAAGGDLHISYGTNPDFALNPKFMTLDAATGNVGIGTSAPAADLHVAGDVRGSGRVAFGNEGIFGADILFDRVFDFTHRVTDFSTSAFFLNPFHTEVFADPPVNVTKGFIGHRLTTRTGIGNTHNFGFVGGCDITTVHSGTGLVDDLRGAAVFAGAASGTISDQIGLLIGSDGTGNANISSNRALVISTGHRNAGGGITDDYGIFVETPARNSPLVNHYGLYLQNQGAPGSFPTSYAIYSDGGQSYFRDAIGIGTATPAAPMHVFSAPDVSPGGGGAIVIGSTTGANLGFDSNEIMARSNGVAADLFINHDGGDVLIGAGGGVGNIGIGTTSPTRGRVDISVAGQRCIYGSNNSPTLATAFFDNTGTGPAGVFDGSVSVIGSLSKSSGSFRIDHPLDPANKYLYHSFVESPDMMNVYNGNIVTDAQGYATIEMPDWFESLNRDFRYQLTVIGQFAQATVSEKLRDGKFTIRTDKPAVEVSWQITGIRRDPWAEAHRVPVEQDKPEHERGKYQHPELYGQPSEMGILYNEKPISTEEAQSSERPN